MVRKSSGNRNHANSAPTPSNSIPTLARKWSEPVENEKYKARMDLGSAIMKPSVQTVIVQPRPRDWSGFSQSTTSVRRVLLGRNGSLHRAETWQTIEPVNSKTTWKRMVSIPGGQIFKTSPGMTIGKGSNAKVKLGTIQLESITQPIAIKVVKRQRLLTRSIHPDIPLVENEIRMLSWLKSQGCKCVVELFGAAVKTEEGVVINWTPDVLSNLVLSKHYLFLELATCSLQSKTDCTREETRKWFRELAQGVDWLHSHGVIHHDIKPGNILVLLNNDIRIADFGVSELKTGKPLWTTKFVGTPQFLAPELIKATDKDDIVVGLVDGAKLDTWACGITLFFLLTGRLPFPFDKEEEEFHGPAQLVDLYERISIGKVDKFPTDLEQDLQDVVKGLLTVSPKQRWTLTKALQRLEGIEIEKPSSTNSKKGFKSWFNKQWKRWF